MMQFHGSDLEAHRPGPTGIYLTRREAEQCVRDAENRPPDPYGSRADFWVEAVAIDL